MFKNKQFVLIIILILLVIGGYTGYRFHQSQLFFDYGQTAAPIDQHDFFDYGVDKKQTGKKS